MIMNMNHDHLKRGIADPFADDCSILFEAVPYKICVLSGLCFVSGGYL